MDQLTRDSTVLRYEEVGRGAPPLVFLHHLGRDHTSFAAQLGYFHRRHRVVVAELPGLDRAAPASRPAIERLADDIAWLCHELAVYRPVLVGQGLGGAVALASAFRLSAPPCAIVYLEAPESSGESTGPRWQPWAEGEIRGGDTWGHMATPAGLEWPGDETTGMLPEWRVPLLTISAMPPAGRGGCLPAPCRADGAEHIIVPGDDPLRQSAEQVNAAIDRFLTGLPLHPSERAPVIA